MHFDFLFKSPVCEYYMRFCSCKVFFKHVNILQYIYNFKNDDFCLLKLVLSYAVHCVRLSRKSCSKHVASVYSTSSKSSSNGIASSNAV